MCRLRRRRALWEDVVVVVGIGCGKVVSGGY